MFINSKYSFLVSIINCTWVISFQEGSFHVLTNDAPSVTSTACSNFRQFFRLELKSNLLS